MTLKKAKEIIELNLEEVKIFPETDPEIPEITRVLQEKGYKWLEQKVTYALCQTKMVNRRKYKAKRKRHSEA